MTPTSDTRAVPCDVASPTTTRINQELPVCTCLRVEAIERGIRIPVLIREANVPFCIDERRNVLGESAKKCFRLGG